MNPSERTVQVPCPSRSIDCFLAFPSEASGQHPAVVVIHEIFGTDDHIRDVARRFAALGYVAAAPNLFSGEVQKVLTPENIGWAMQAFSKAPPELRRDPTLFASFAQSQPPERRPILQAFGMVTSPAAQSGFALDLRAVTQYLRTLPEVDPARIGSVGFCWGGAMSARLATMDPDLKAAVIFYGQNPPMDDIPRIRASVLGLYGSEDPGITSTVPDLASAMKKVGKSFDSHVYAGARHAFFNDTRPNYHEASAKDAWIRVQRFFAASLGGPSPPDRA